MKNKRFFVMTLLLLAVVLILFVGLGAAQETDPETPSSPDNPSSVEAVGAAFPVQGRLTGANGNPLNGTYDLTFRVYDVLSGGTAICEDTDAVVVANGLFNGYVHFCTPDDINGRQLYLGIEVGSDGEMSPRQSIYPVPYAWSLRPGAEIVGESSDEILTAENDGSGTAIIGRSVTDSVDGVGVAGTSLAGSGVKGLALTGIGVQGDSFTGVAIQATGTGIIQSTADSEIAISPLKMVAPGSLTGDIELIPTDSGFIKVRANTSDFYYVYLPVDLPTLLFGTPIKLKSVRVCNQNDQTASYLSSAWAYYLTDSGTYSSLITDFTDRQNTDWDCFTFSDSAPTEIQGSLTLAFGLEFSGTGSSHDIHIGNIILTVTE